MSNDHVQLAALLSKLLDSTLSSSEHEQLETLLSASESARRIYLDTIDTHIALSAELGATAAAALDGAMLDEILLDKGSIDDALSTSELRQPLRARIARLFNRPVPLSLTIATLVIGLLITGMAFVITPLFHDSAVNNTQTPARIVAALARLHQVEWASGQPKLVPGDSLLEHQTVGLKSGLIELNMIDGATLMLEGPLSIRFDSAGAVTLNEGSLVARVPKQAIGFTVQSPFGALVDLGTEFGVAVRSNSVVAMVYQGVVEFRPDHQAPSSGGRHVLRRGQSLRVNRQGVEVSPASEATKLAFARSVPGPESSILFDFGSHTHPTNVSQGVHWNNIASGFRDDVAGVVVAQAKSAAGTTTDISLALDDPGEGKRRLIGDLDVPGLSVTSPTGIAYPASATRDVAAVFNRDGFSPRRVITLSGCAAAAKYDVLLFASTGVHDRTTVWSINGITQSLATANNRQRFVQFNDISPVAGQITIEFSASSPAKIANLATLELVLRPNPGDEFRNETPSKEVTP